MTRLKSEVQDDIRWVKQEIRYAQAHNDNDVTELYEDLDNLETELHELLTYS